MMAQKTRRLVVRVEYDQDLENPADFDCQWKPYSFSRRHQNYADPESIGLARSLDDDGNPKITSPGLRRKMEVGLAFFLSYFEHGQCAWMLKRNPHPGCEFQWDGTRNAGLLVWEHDPSEIGAKSYEDRAKDAEQFLDTYTAWCNGDGYWFSVEDEDGGHVDSCGGFIGDPKDSGMLETIAESTKGAQVRFEGLAADWYFSAEDIGATEWDEDEDLDD